MTNFRSVVLMLALGALGAVAAGASLFLTAPTDVAFSGYGSWIYNELPVLTVVVSIGFVAGMLIAILWSFLVQIFAENSPRT